jgi:hypothetical protein
MAETGRNLREGIGDGLLGADIRLDGDMPIA